MMEIKNNFMFKNFIPKISNAIGHIIKPEWLTKEVLATVNLKHRRFCVCRRLCGNATLIRYVEVQRSI